MNTVAMATARGIYEKLTDVRLKRARYTSSLMRGDALSNISGRAVAEGVTHQKLSGIRLPTARILI